MIEFWPFIARPPFKLTHFTNSENKLPGLIVYLSFPEGPSFGSIEVHHAGTDIITLGWAPTEREVESHHHLVYSCNNKAQIIHITDSYKVDIVDLSPGTQYTFSIIRIADGKHSLSASVSVCTGKHDS